MRVIEWHSSREFTPLTSSHGKLRPNTEGCLLANVTQTLIDQQLDYDPAAIVSDVENAIAHTHISGSMHSAVMADPELYIKPSTGVKELLSSLHAAGKKLFLASNSSFEFVDRGMCHVFGKSWRSIFDLVLVSADKPNFFSGKHRRPFREVNPLTGRPQMHKVRELRSDAVYAAGGVESLQGTVLVFEQEFALENAIGSHDCRLEAHIRATSSVW
jgi:HAD superfamily 5'-nucleotidase-like hydrolase